MENKFNLTKKANLIVCLTILLFLIEILVTLYINYSNHQQTRIAGAYKIIFQVILLLLIDFKNLSKKIVPLILALTIVFILGLSINPILKTEFNFLFQKGSIYYFNRYVFIFLVTVILYTQREMPLIINKALKFLELILIANGLLIIIGLIFNLKIFESYAGSVRFGYDGIFNKINEASHIYSIYLMYLYYCVFILKNKHWAWFLFTVSISLLLGTKMILLFLFLLFLVHIFFVNKNLKLKAIVLLAFFGFVISFEKIVTFVFNIFPFWKQLGEKHELLTLLFSMRDILFYNATDYISHSWNNINYFIGGAFYAKSFVISQIDGVDLFLFFGALGSSIYLLLFVLTFMKKHNTILNILVAIILTCGFLSGALLTSAMSMLLLFLTSFSLHEKYIFELRR